MASSLIAAVRSGKAQTTAAAVAEETSELHSELVTPKGEPSKLDDIAEDVRAIKEQTTETVRELARHLVNHNNSGRGSHA